MSAQQQRAADERARGELASIRGGCCGARAFSCKDQQHIPRKDLIWPHRGRHQQLAGAAISDEHIVLQFWSSPPTEGVVALSNRETPSSPGTSIVPYRVTVKTAPTEDQFEMYNVSADPLEQSNLYGNPSYSSRRTLLTNLLEQAMRQAAGAAEWIGARTTSELHAAVS